MARQFGVTAKQLRASGWRQVVHGVHVAAEVGADYDGEVHGERWRYDLERQERIRDQGWWHRRYTSLHITAGWQQMVRQIGGALVAAGWRPGAADHAQVAHLALLQQALTA